MYTTEVLLDYNVKLENLEENEIVLKLWSALDHSDESCTHHNHVGYILVGKLLILFQTIEKIVYVLYAFIGHIL